MASSPVAAALAVLVLVGSDPEGTIKGRTIQPLHGGAPKAMQADKELYAVRALIDVLRVGRTREGAFAKEELPKKMAHVRV